MKAPQTTSFPIAPAGNHIARCYLMVDMGMQAGSYDGVPNLKHKVRVSFELCNKPMEDGRPFSVSKNYTFSLHEKSALCIDLESWRGRAFQGTEKAEFNLFGILGKSCMVNVIHKDFGEGDLKALIRSISPIPEGMTAPALVNDIVKYSIEDGTQAEFDALPDWLQKKINIPAATTQSEYDQSAGLSDAGASGYHPRPVQHGSPQPDTPPSMDDFSDDIPF